MAVISWPHECKVDRLLWDAFRLYCTLSCSKLGCKNSTGFARKMSWCLFLSLDMSFHSFPHTQTHAYPCIWPGPRLFVCKKATTIPRSASDVPTFFHSRSSLMSLGGLHGRKNRWVAGSCDQELDQRSFRSSVAADNAANVVFLRDFWDVFADFFILIEAITGGVLVLLSLMMRGAWGPGGSSSVKVLDRIEVSLQVSETSGMNRCQHKWWGRTSDSKSMPQY